MKVKTNQFEMERVDFLRKSKIVDILSKKCIINLVQKMGASHYYLEMSLFITIIDVTLLEVEMRELSVDFRRKSR